MFRIISEEQAQALCGLEEAWGAIEEAYCAFGHTPEIQSRPSIMAIEGPRPVLGNSALGQFRIKGASVPSFGAAGAFLYTRDHPYMYLWSTETDAPIGLVASDWLSQYRVAVTVAYAIDKLAGPVVRRIAIFGVGKFGAGACRLLAEQWPDAMIDVLASSPERSHAFAATMPTNVRAADDPRAAVEAADVVVTLTNAKAPLVEAGWLARGALLLSMGSAHEVEADVLHEVDALIVDDFSYAKAQGDLAAWIRRGEVAEQDVAGRVRSNIGEVAAGLKPGRLHSDEKILAVLQGLTACDVCIAKAVLDRAIAENVGQVASL